MKKLFLSVAAAILAFPVLADEGMWLLPLLKQQKVCGDAGPWSAIKRSGSV